ncbi:hypothetical protein HK096_008538 [Nowakowskiella sp. JEL0078]|nr:hypothetical protein HK096_008538 [Nowakowskiella sp. JEL0078]
MATAKKRKSIFSQLEGEWIDPPVSDGIIENAPYPLSLELEMVDTTRTVFYKLLFDNTITFRNYMYHSGRLLHDLKSHREITPTSIQSAVKLTKQYILKNLPENYSLLTHSFVPKNSPDKITSTKNIDDYVFGHPFYNKKFRSIPEWSLHLQWLGTFNLNNENDYLDYLNCTCGPCSHYIQEIYLRIMDLTRLPFSKNVDLKVPIPFRVAELVWVSVVIDLELGEVLPVALPSVKDIPSFSTLQSISEAIVSEGSPTSSVNTIKQVLVNSLSTDRKVVVYWPAIVHARKFCDSSIPVSVGLTADNPKKFFNLPSDYPKIMFTVKLITRQEYLNVTLSSLIPYWRIDIQKHSPQWPTTTETEIKLAEDLKNSLQKSKEISKCFAKIKSKGLNPKDERIWLGPEILQVKIKL